MIWSLYPSTSGQAIPSAFGLFISALTRDDTSHFPLYNDHIFFLLLLIPEAVDKFVQEISRIESPIIIKNIFCLGDIEYDRDVIIQIIRFAPLCCENYEQKFQEWRWNKQLIAPIILDVAFKHAIRLMEVSNREETYAELEEFFLLVANELKRRDDGFFLAYNYVGQLLFLIEPKSQHEISIIRSKTAKLYLNVLAQEFEEISGSVLNLNSLGFPNGYIDKVKKFYSTGLLVENPDRSLFSIFRRQIAFLHSGGSLQITEELLENFEKILAFKDKEFYTSQYSDIPEEKHFEIADIYIMHPDPIKKWKNTWMKFSSALHYLAFNPYGEMALNIYYNVNFILSVGIAIIDYFIEDDDNQRFKEMWLCIWNITIERIKRPNINKNDFVEKILPLLIVRKFIMLKQGLANSIQQVTNIFNDLKDLSETPQLIITCLNILEQNGLDFKRDTSIDDKYFIVSMCREAQGYFAKEDFNKKKYNYCIELSRTLEKEVPDCNSKFE